MKNMKSRKDSFTRMKLFLFMATVFAAVGADPAHAIAIDTGNPDIAMRWDNMIRYNAGWRMEKPNPDFYNNSGYDETEGHFKRGDMVTNRLDLVSEMDFAYKRDYGFRVSGALWSESNYGDTSRTNPLLATSYGPAAPTSNYGQSGGFSRYAKRYTTGSSGEFLDAFVFGRFDMGSTSLRFKIGQHNVYWGEALYTIADGVSAGQGPIDTIKAATSPGAEAKELFMPLNQISAQWSLTNDLSLIGQYLLDWKPYRIVPGGTFFANGDGAGNPPCASATVGGGCIASLEDITPKRNKGGDYGLGLRWAPAWLDGTMGVYYRKYDEKLPWSVTQAQGGPAGLTNPANLGVRLSYARDTEMLGISFNKSIAGVSVGAEISHRRNTALNSVAGFFAASGGADTTGVTQVAPGVFLPNFFLSAAAFTPLSQTPTNSQAEGARGDTWHAVLNGIWLLPNTVLWDGGTLQGEFAYQRLDKVTKNANLFYSQDYACRLGYLPAGIVGGSLNKGDGCATKDSLVFNMGFAPEWAQVLPGLNLKMPTFLSYGLMGNSPTIGGSNEGAYKWSIGLSATYNALYEFSLAYTDSHADYKRQAGSPANGSVPGVPVVSTKNGAAELNNHAWLSFTFKTSF